jgi:hypothetical protein
MLMHFRLDLKRFYEGRIVLLWYYAKLHFSSYTKSSSLMEKWKPHA